MNHKLFKTKALFVIALLFGSALIAQTNPVFEVKRVSSSVVLLQQEELYKLNMIAIDCGSYIVVIDTLSSPSEAKAARMKLKGIFKKPVKYVINTHHHWDHTFGNQVFADAQIIGHKSCAEDMMSEYSNKEGLLEQLNYIANDLDSQQYHMEKGSYADKKRSASLSWYRRVIGDYKDNFKLTLPDILVGDRAEMKLGNKTFRLYNVPGLHTRSNLIIHVVEEGLIVHRPQFRKDHLPGFERDIYLLKLIKASEEINNCRVKLSFLVPGHGDPIPAENISLHLKYLWALNSAVRVASSEADVMNQFPVKDFPIVQSLNQIHGNNIAYVWESKK